MQVVLLLVLANTRLCVCSSITKGMTGKKKACGLHHLTLSKAKAFPRHDPPNTTTRDLHHYYTSFARSTPSTVLIQHLLTWGGILDWK